jgi:hypothetical protein
MIIDYSLESFRRRFGVAEANGLPAPLLETIGLVELHLAPQFLSDKKLQALVASETALPPLAVVRWRGVHYLHDGHHRAWIAWIRGHKEMLAKVIDLGV